MSQLKFPCCVGRNGDAAYAASCVSLQDQCPTDLQQLYTRPGPQHAPSLADLFDDQHPFTPRQAQDSRHKSPHSASGSRSLHTHYGHPSYRPHATDLDHTHVGHLDISSCGRTPVHTLLGNLSSRAHATDSDHTHCGHANLGSCGTTPIHTCAGHPCEHAHATNSDHTHFGRSDFSCGEPTPVHSSFGHASHSPQLPSLFLVDVNPAHGTVHNLHRLERVDCQQNSFYQGSPDQSLDMDDILTLTTGFQNSIPSLPGHKQDFSLLTQAELPQPSGASTDPSACCKQGPNQNHFDQQTLCAKSSAGYNQSSSQDHFVQLALCADTSLARRWVHFIWPCFMQLFKSSCAHTLH